MSKEETDWLGSRKLTLLWSWLLAVYLVFVAASAAWLLISIFPSPPPVVARFDTPAKRKTSASSAARSRPAPPAASAPSVASVPLAASAGPGMSVPAPSASAAVTGGDSNGNASADRVEPAKDRAATPAPVPSTVPSELSVAEEERPTWPTELKYGSFHHFGLSIEPETNDQGILILALLAGILGSFMHAAQSLAIYVGNRDLRKSWVLLYALRPMIGGVLGLLFYFVLRAGLIPAAAASSTDAVSPYGVVAFGALAGWFSKRVTDKLAEMVDMLFRTQKDAYKENTVRDGIPEIIEIAPSKISVSAVAAEGQEFIVTCDKIMAGAWIVLDGAKYLASFKGDMKIAFTLSKAAAEALLGKTSVLLIVYNAQDPGADAEAKPRPSAPLEIEVVA